MAEGRSVNGRQAIRIDWIQYRVTAATIPEQLNEIGDWRSKSGCQTVTRSCRVREGENKWEGKGRETKEGSRVGWTGELEDS